MCSTHAYPWPPIVDSSWAHHRLLYSGSGVELQLLRDSTVTSIGGVLYEHEGGSSGGCGKNGTTAIRGAGVMDKSVEKPTLRADLGLHQTKNRPLYYHASIHDSPEESMQTGELLKESAC